ncbi:MAG: riboflavin synthase [candidate division Zixibacteria bacterium]|nr:riboflavin synthase [candidate division Zixibacteria bacterium]
MFTGIIQERGSIKSVFKQGDALLIQVKAPQSAASLTKGASVSINGACQSAVNISDDWFEVLATPETVSRTNFQYLKAGDEVNLELPLTLNDPLGGHIVSGHVDTVGKIISLPAGGHGLARDAESAILRISFAKEYSKYLIEKGSVSIDGISLTVFDIEPNAFSVSLIPETIEQTNLKYRRAGDNVNLEFDMIGKYVEKIFNNDKESLSMDFLKQHGFMR